MDKGFYVFSQKETGFLSNNNSSFTGTILEDIWNINAGISLKDQPLIELIRCAVLWVLWTEKNKLCFNECHQKSVQALGLQIINLANF